MATAGAVATGYGAEATTRVPRRRDRRRLRTRIRTLFSSVTVAGVALALTAACTAGTAATGPPPDPSVVQTTEGAVQGTVTEGHHGFQAVPHAAGGRAALAVTASPRAVGRRARRHTARRGFTRLVPSIVVVVGYIAAFGLMSQALTRGMTIGVAYGVWAAAGVALVAIIGVVFLGENMTWVQVGGIALVIAGVLALELGARHPA